MSGRNWLDLNELTKKRSETGIKRQITQAESQQLTNIISVLEYLQKKNQCTAILLIKHTKLSRHSIDRIIKRLLGKSIIELIQTKKHNEKVYRVKSKKLLKSYCEDLVFYNYFKTSKNEIGGTKSRLKPYLKRLKRVYDIRRMKTKSNIMREKQITKKFLNTPFKIPTKDEQIKLTTVPWPQPVFINQMGSKHVLKIMNYYKNNQLCDVCLKENKLSKLEIIDNNESVCSLGHVIPFYDSNYKNISYTHYDHTKEDKIRQNTKLSDSELKAQINKYVRSNHTAKISYDDDEL